MNDRSPTTRSTGPPTSSGVDLADVGPVVHPHARVVAQRPDQLAVARRRRPPPRAAPARSSTSVNPPVDAPGVQAPATCDLQPERARTTASAPSELVRRHGWRSRARSGSARTTRSASVVTPVAGLVATALLTLTRPGGDQLAGVLARTGQAAAYQLGVQPQSPRRHGSALADPNGLGSPAPLSTWRSDSCARSKTAT